VVGKLLNPANLCCPRDKHLEVDGTDTHALHPLLA
jgi:hypothetical protein